MITIHKALYGKYQVFIKLESIRHLKHNEMRGEAIQKKNKTMVGTDESFNRKCYDDFSRFRSNVFI